MSARIMFVGLFRWNAGSSQTLIGYRAAGEKQGCEIAICADAGFADDKVAELVPVRPLSWATHLVFAYEDPQFLSHEEIERCLIVPRQRRIVIDTDAHWGPLRAFGSDSTGGIFGSARWHELYRELSDTILQPRLGGLPSGTEYFAYFGMQTPGKGRYRAGDEKPEIQYIGNNWWRWEALQNLVRDNAAPDRRIVVRGRWWNDETCPGYRDATWSDPELLRRYDIAVAPSVPLGKVVSTMSEAAVTPVLSRPKLSSLQLLLPRVFETLAAGTLPYFPATMSYLLDVLPELTPFVQRATEAPLIPQLLADRETYLRDLNDAQRAAYERFNYDTVFAQLHALLTK